MDDVHRHKGCCEQQQRPCRPQTLGAQTVEYWHAMMGTRAPNVRQYVAWRRVDTPRLAKSCRVRYKKTMQISPNKPPTAPQGSPSGTSLRPTSPKAQDLVAALELFAELVGPFGPLLALRFDGAVFSACTHKLARPADEDAIERCFDRHAATLATSAFLAHFHKVLAHFCQMDWVDDDHKDAARLARALTPQTTLDAKNPGQDVPALYPIFRAQVLAALNSTVDILELS